MFLDRLRQNIWYKRRRGIDLVLGAGNTLLDTARLLPGTVAEDLKIVKMNNKK
jgi:hypothetical protein